MNAVGHIASSIRLSSKAINDLKNHSLFADESARKIKLGSKAPSVSTILSKTQSAESVYLLQKWMERMKREMGEEEFRLYQQQMLRNGTKIHSEIEGYLTDRGHLQLTPAIEGYWNSVRSELKNFSEVKATETKLGHQSLHYSGIIDCVAKHTSASSGYCVIDWKTSQRKKKQIGDTFDQPLQVAAYAGLWNINHPDNQIEEGMLVLMYADGAPCDIIRLDKKELLGAWQLWTARIQLYWQRRMDEQRMW